MIASIVLSFVILLIIGAPIAMCLALGAIVPLTFFSDISAIAVIQKFFTSIDSASLMAVPFFIVAGGLLSEGGVSKRLVDFAYSLVGWLPGGLAIVTFVASAFFGAICGSAAATCSAIGAILIPELTRKGYPLPFSLATVASAGFLGIIIPPSIPMIIYGQATGTSVSELFMAGVIPGILLTVSMSIYAFFWGKVHRIPTQKFQLIRVWQSFKSAIWALIMPFIILGGIYGGIFTATEAGAVSCAYGFLAGLFIYKELNLKLIVKIIRSSVVTCAMIMFIIAAANAFALVLTRENIPQLVSGGLLRFSGESVFLFYLLVTILLLFVGTFMETLPAIMILAPILSLALAPLGQSSVAFGIVMIVNLAIGVITPPLGLDLYVAAGVAKAPVSAVINRHLLCYGLCSFLVLVLIMVFPQISTLLPSMMG